VPPDGVVGWHVYTTGGIAGSVGTLDSAGVLFMGLLADMIRTHTKY